MKQLRSGKIAKILYRLRWKKVLCKKLVSEKKYSIAYRKLLADYGMNIAQDCYYIDPTA